jgi:hypothetical protein
MLTSIVRTLVPLLVGFAGPWVTNWLGWTDAELTSVLTVVVSGLYYLVVRLLEQVWPGVGVLLGVAVQPTYARDGRHEAGRDEDAGRAGLRMILTAATLVGLVLLTVPASASAGQWRRPPRPLVVPHVVSAQDCDGTLWVVYGARVVSGGSVTDVLDDGLTGGLELLDISGRSQPYGTWIPVQAGRGGEGRLRAPLFAEKNAGSHFQMARVVRDDTKVTSGPVRITPGCPS